MEQFVFGLVLHFSCTRRLWTDLRLYTLSRVNVHGWICALHFVAYAGFGANNKMRLLDM